MREPKWSTELEEKRMSKLAKLSEIISQAESELAINPAFTRIKMAESKKKLLTNSYRESILLKRREYRFARMHCPKLLLNAEYEIEKNPTNIACTLRLFEYMNKSTGNSSKVYGLLDALECFPSGLEVFRPTNGVTIEQYLDAIRAAAANKKYFFSENIQDISKFEILFTDTTNGKNGKEEWEKWYALTTY